MTELEDKKEVFILKQKEFNEFLIGKSLQIISLNRFFIEIRPPNYGIKISYENWRSIKENLLCNPALNIDTILHLIDKIERDRDND